MLTPLPNCTYPNETPTKRPQTLSRVGFEKEPQSRQDRWQSDIVLAPSYVVNTCTDRAYQEIFSGPEWLNVLPTESEALPSEGDIRFPSSYKLQELLLARLAEGQVHVQLYEILQHLVLYGTVYAKIFWYSKRVTSHLWGNESLEVTDEPSIPGFTVRFQQLARLHRSRAGFWGSRSGCA